MIMKITIPNGSWSLSHEPPSESGRTLQRPQRPVRDRPATASDGYHARLHKLLDTEGLQDADQRVQLLPVTGGLHRDRVQRHVDHLRTEQLYRLEHPGPVFGVGADLDQDQLALDRCAGLKLYDLQDVDELVEL